MRFGRHRNGCILCITAFTENAWKFYTGVFRFAKSVFRHYCLSENKQLGEMHRSHHHHPVLHMAVPSSSKPDDTTPASLKPHIIIIGAGPSGLLAAIHIAIDFPQLNILILEREYPRTHEVRIDPANIHDEILRDEVNKLGTLKDKNTRRVYIDVLRACMLRRANTLCISIEKVNVADARFVCENYPDCRTILIAEGAHSKLRKEIFGCDENAVDAYPFQNIVQVQYTTAAPAASLSLAHVHRVAQLSAYAFEESVYISPSSSLCKVTGRFFVSDNIYAGLPLSGGTQGSPMRSQDLCDDLKESISIWMNVRKDQEPSALKITKFQLAAYACRDFSSRTHMRNWILIGDAAFAVPYFRALNAGAFCASHVPEWLRAFFSRLTVNRQSRLTTLEQQFLRRKMFLKFAQELIMAASKDAVIETVNTILFFTSSAPESSQLNQWSYFERNALKIIHPIFAQDTSTTIAATTNPCASSTHMNHSLKSVSGFAFAVVFGIIAIFILLLAC